jgi:hypothetical protein
MSSWNTCLVVVNTVGVAGVEGCPVVDVSKNSWKGGDAASDLSGECLSYECGIKVSELSALVEENSEVTDPTQ